MEELSKLTQELPLHAAWVAIRYQFVQYATIIRGTAHLLLIQGGRTDAHTALLAPIENDANSIIHGHIHEALLAFERILVGYTQSPNVDKSVAPATTGRSSHGQPCEPSVAEALRNLVDHLRTLGVQMRDDMQRYKASALPSSEQQDDLVSLEQALNSYFEVLNVIVEDVFLRRIKPMPYEPPHLFSE
jgi:hypothetical protein